MFYGKVKPYLLFTEEIYLILFTRLIALVYNVALS